MVGEILEQTASMLRNGPVAVEAPSPVSDDICAQSAELLQATAHGPDETRRVAGQLGDVESVLMFCIPANWHTPETLDLCRRLSEDDAQSVLTWLSLVFHQGHSVGFRDATLAANDNAAAAANAAE